MLKQMVSKPKWKQMWSLVYRWRMDAGFEFCRLCFRNDELTFDHIIPRSRGGGNEMENITILCFLCNNAKGSRLIDLPALVWPPPGFELKSGEDVEIGDFLTCGLVTNKDEHYVSPGHTLKKLQVWHCDLDTQYAMLMRSGTKTTVVSGREYITVPKEYHGYLS